MPSSERDPQQAVDLLDGVDAITNVIKEQRNPERLLWALCGKVLEIFECDRAWLLFPCDPDSPTWSVPIERTRPEYPGANLAGKGIDMTPDVSAIFRAALESESPVVYGPGGRTLAENTKSFSVKSQLSMAIYPRVGKPWQFGVHQCSHSRTWTDQELRLFQIIGILTAEALGNLLLTRDLQAANKHLEQRVSERTAELESRKNFEESLVETAQAIVLVLDKEGRIVRFNPYLEEISGFRLSEVQGKDWCRSFLPERDQSKMRELFRQAVKGVAMRGVVNAIVTQDGRERTIQWYDKTLKDERGETTGVLAVGHDVTEQARIEEELRSTIEDKEILLKEIHHRVKNNMQIVSSLLRIQRSYLGETGNSMVLDAFRETEQRINSMALVHDRLYRSRDVARIDLSTYIEQLANELIQTFRMESSAIALKTNIEAVRISITQAIPCGLILNELVSNAIKYAFPEGSEGWIEVAFHRVADRAYELSVRDNGVGLPQGFRLESATTMGMVIVDSLVRQLGGTLSISNQNGAAFSIRFQVDRHRVNRP